MESIFDFSPVIVAVIPIIVGLVAVVKGLGLKPKIAPVMSIVFGIGLMSLVSVISWQAALTQGIIAGLAASGLFSGVKKVTE